jgi:hypothetical protein
MDYFTDRRLKAEAVANYKYGMETITGLRLALWLKPPNLRRKRQ